MSTYTVQNGDSWSRIAGNVYGDQRWMQYLQEANSQIGGLKAGMVLEVPDLPDAKPVITNDWWNEQVGSVPTTGAALSTTGSSNAANSMVTMAERSPAYRDRSTEALGITGAPPTPKPVPQLSGITPPSYGPPATIIPKVQPAPALETGKGAKGNFVKGPEPTFWEKFIEFAGRNVTPSIGQDYTHRITPMGPLDGVTGANSPLQAWNNANTPAPSTGRFDGQVQRIEQIGINAKANGKKYTKTAEGQGIYHPFNLDKVRAAVAWLNAGEDEQMASFTPYSGYGNYYSGGSGSGGSGRSGGGVSAAVRSPEFTFGLVNWRNI